MWIPRWLPGETLYSLCARAAASSGLDARKASVELLGDVRGFRRQDIPVGLARLQQLCTASWGIEVRFDLRTIQDRTALGLAVPFFDVHQQSLLLSGLLANQFSLSLRQKSGFNRGRETFGLPLRRCPDCERGDISRFGFAYWHAMHQYPGVIVCPVHARPLQWLVDGPRKGGPWEVAHRGAGDFKEICVEGGHVEPLALVAGAILWCTSHTRLSRSALSMMLRWRFRSQGLMRRETVLEAIEEQRIHRKIAGLLCKAELPYFSRFEEPGWVSKVLSDGDFAHPLRWAVLIATTLPEGWQLRPTPSGDEPLDDNPPEGIETPTDLDSDLIGAQKRAPQLNLFSAGRCARLGLAPESLYEALGNGRRLAEAAQMSGHDLEEVRRWLRRDSHLVQHWHDSIACARIQEAQGILTQFLRDHPDAMRSAVIRANLSPVRLLERYAPDALDRILPAVMSKYSPQRRLWTND